MAEESIENILPIYLLIGKSIDCDIVLNSPDISRKHAELVYTPEKKIIIRDLDSTNGTYINEILIKQKEVEAEELIVFGKQEGITARELLHRANIYIEEFDALKDVYNRYGKEKIHIQSSNQFKTRVLQFTPFAIPGILGMLIASFSQGRGSTTLFGISIILTILAPLLGIYLGAKQSSKVPEKLYHNTDQFKIDYVCPKCGTFLGDIPWISLKNRGKCIVPGCKARWRA